MEMVKSWPLYVENNKVGLLFSSEERIESSIIPIKHTILNSNKFSNVYSKVVENNENLQKYKTLFPSKKQTESFKSISEPEWCNEILAPCCFESILLLSMNFDDFFSIWKSKYNTLWKWNDQYKLLKFCLSTELIEKPSILCFCGNHNLLLDQELEWITVPDSIR